MGGAGYEKLITGALSTNIMTTDKYVMLTLSFIGSKSVKK